MDWTTSTHRTDEISIQQFSMETSTEETAWRTWKTGADRIIMRELVKNTSKVRTGLERLTIEPNPA